MEALKIPTAQFEIKGGDKDFNLAVIGKLPAEAARKESDIISFHECSITDLTYKS